MKFKRMLCIMATLIMTMGLFSGCGSDSAKNNSANDNDSTKQSSQNTTSENTGSPDKQEQTASDGAAKTLVVYYSATGSTEKVAQTIAKTAGADIFEITPVDKYTNDDLDWTDDDSRVSKEHNDESLRDVELTQVTPDNWESYDTVLVGYPIWWGIAA